MKKIDIGLSDFVASLVAPSIPIIVGLICMSLVIIPFRIEVTEDVVVQGVVEFDISDFGFEGIIQMKLESINNVFFKLSPDSIIRIGWHNIMACYELEFPANNVSMISFKTWNNVSRTVSIHLVGYTNNV